MTDYTLMCANCNEITTYASSRAFLKAKNNKTLCAKCRGKSPRRRDIGITNWSRECPSCKTIKYYSSKRNLTRAINTNSNCPNCHSGPSADTIKLIVKTLKAKKYPNRKSNTKVGKPAPFKRNCPVCDKELSYVSERSCSRANIQNSICNSCSSRVYKKSWVYVIKDKHTKQMAATKAGYSSYAEYMKDLDSKKKYYREVSRITRQQDISILENFDKLRGLCGVNGAYQLDHIIPISVAYSQNLSPKQIGNITNLQIIPWKDNLQKSNKIL